MRPEQVLTALKRILKEKKMTYAELATEMGLTESGIKKLLRAKDLSLGRLSQIAEVLGLSAHDVLALAQEDPIQEVRLTPRQEKTLLENPLLLRVYWRLAIEGQSATDIRTAENLGEKELSGLLRMLDKLGLVHARDEGYAARHRGLYRWSEQGPLVRELNRRWSLAVVQQSLSRKQNGSPALHRLVSMKLDDESRVDFEKELHHLIDETLRKSRREKSGGRRKTASAYSLVVSALPASLIDGDRSL